MDYEENMTQWFSQEQVAVIHRREKMTVAKFQQALEAAREQMLKAATTRVPNTKHAQNLAKRFRENGEASFRFIITPGIAPTNNLAEQAIRFVVIDRHITQGTRSEKGPPLVPTDLDRYRHLRPTGSYGLPPCSTLSKLISPVLRHHRSCRPAPDALSPAVLPLSAVALSSAYVPP